MARKVDQAAAARELEPVDAELVRQVRYAAIEARAEALARLVWDHADDRDFLLTALVYEVAGNVPDAAGQPEIPSWVNYLLRATLSRIADELVDQCPNRGPFEVSL